MKKSLLILGTVFCTVLISFTTAKKPSAKQAKKVLDGFCSYIPSGSAKILDDSVSIQSFYMSQTEITNIQYQEFLYDLKKKGDLENYKAAMIDTAKWNTAFSWEMSKYSDYYHKHSAYRDYPVVNITKEGAELYCKWLSKKYDSISGGEMSLTFRLPTRKEWVYAAKGDLKVSPYGWGGPYLRNSKGMILANFTRIGAENVHFNEDEQKYEIKFIQSNGRVINTTMGDGADVTAPAQSYYPNGYGLYNMNGNVSEMVSDEDVIVGGDWRCPGYDIRNESAKKYTGANPITGFRVVASHVKKEK